MRALVPGVPLADLVADLGGALLGPPERQIERLAPLDAADPGCISFLAHPKYRSQWLSTQAGCVIISPAMQADAMPLLPGTAAIVTPDPYAYFARLTRWWAQRTRPAPAAQVHPTAVVHDTARLGQGVHLGPFVVVEAGADIGDHASIGAHCVVGENAHIGAGTRLAPHVTLAFDCHLGARCIVHSGVVIGADGFGFAPVAGHWEKIEQLGAVHIGDDVEIGANTCVDRGALGDTVIEDGVKIDNLVQIAHNVRVGAHSALAGCVGVAGSAQIGARCAIGGGAVILGHLRLADGVSISAASVVTRSILKPGLYTGFFPLDSNEQWERNAATVKHLHALRGRVRALERTEPSS